MDFPCNKCGNCCRNLHLNSLYKDLDRGDGTCKHFNTETKFCNIYSRRPLKCNVAMYYKKHLSSFIEWEDFVLMNKKYCK